VRVRRKTRDFMFPPEGAGDPFLLYDGGTFHASRTLSPQFATENGLRVKVVREGEDVTQEGETVFALGRAVSTYLTPQGEVHHVRVRIVDRAPEDAGLTPQTIYYYQILGDLVPSGVNPAPYRATAPASAFFGFGRDLYRLLPAIHQQYDEKRELRNFLTIFGEQLDLLRSLAEGLRGLRDVDNCGGALSHYRQHSRLHDLGQAPDRLGASHQGILPQCFL
jgi:hypothetical protein